MKTDIDLGLQYNIKLIVGDWSGDGHGMTESVQMKSNKSKMDVIKAYQIGTKLVGFDMIETICSEFEDNKIPEDNFRSFIDKIFPRVSDQLKHFNLDNEDDLLSSIKDGYVSVDYEYWASIFAMIAMAGDDELILRFNEDIETINIGGYGLFSL